MPQLTFQRLTLSALDDHVRSKYEQMTAPENRCYLQEGVESSYFAVGALMDGVPIGLGLARQDSGRRAAFESLYVSPEFQGGNESIGEKLLEELEKEAKKDNYYIASFLYPTDSPTRVFFERILNNRGWIKPHTYIKNYFFNCLEFHPPWFEKAIPFPAGYNEFSWSDLTPEEKQKILHQIDEGIVPEQVSPFTKQEPEPINSLGLRYQGEVIGWMITHRSQPDTIRYSALFVQRAYQYRGVAIHLLVNAILLQQQAGVPRSLFEVNLYQIDYNWLQFVKRRLAPYAQAVTSISRSYKEL